MITKFFGQFLLEKGIIDKHQLLTALDEQRAQSPLLGELAVEMGLLTKAQAKTLNAAQMKEDKRFGDLAIEKELLTDAQVNELLENQRKKRPYIGQVLVRLGFLTDEQVTQLLAEHGKDRDTNTQHINTEVDSCFAPKLAHRIIDVFPKIYQRVCKRAIALHSIHSSADAQSAAQPRWQQNITLNQRNSLLSLSLLCSQQNALQIGSAFMNMPLQEFDELSIDAVNEFLNTFTGHVYFHAEENIDSSAISPPTFMPTNELAANETLIMRFDGGDCRCDIVVELRDK